MNSTRTSRGGYGRKVAIVAATVAMTIAMAFGAVASASALDTSGVPTGTTTGSITVYKYKTDTASSTPGTGSTQTVTNGTPLPGAVFTLTPLSTAAVEGAVSGTAAAKSVTDVTANLAAYQSGAAAQTITTGADGSGTLSGLAFGYYLMQETTTPAGVTKSADCIITLPYKSSTTGTTITDLKVYPKDVNNSPVVKKVESTSQDNKIIGVNDTVTYDLFSNFTTTAATDIYNATGPKYMTLSITDTPNSVSGHSVLDYTSATAKVIYADGTSAPFDISNFTITNTLSTDATLKFDLTSAGAQNLAGLWKAGTTISSIEIIPVFTANTYLRQLATTQGLVNTAKVNATDTNNVKLIDNKEGQSDPLGTGAFNFMKMSFDSSTSAVSPLAGTTWHVASSEANANSGQYLMDGTTELTWTSGSDGVVAIGALTTSTLKDGASAYTAVAAAYKTALDATTATTNGTADVSVWIVENAPSGYKGLAPQEVKLHIVCTQNADGVKSYTTTAGTGNIDSTASYATSASTAVTAASTQFGIMNAKDGQTVPGSFALPNTGGMGTIVFIVVGTLLVAAGCFYFMSRRNRQQKNQ